jgi:hypothetical protein
MKQRPTVDEHGQFANNLGQKFERSHGYPGRRISWVRGVGSVGGGASGLLKDTASSQLP